MGKLPILSSSAEIYTNFSLWRYQLFKRKEIEVSLRKDFELSEYSKMHQLEFEKLSSMFSKFGFMGELSDDEKNVIFAQFREPFYLLDRVFDTFTNIGNKFNGKCIVFQDGKGYALSRIVAGLPNSEDANVFKLMCGAWKTLSPLAREINPRDTEVMFIFCCILWNNNRLDGQISEDVKHKIARARLILFKEMREFYEYDDEKWQRIYLLKDFIDQVEKCVEEFKSSC